MPSLRTRRLFISHAWRYDDDYRTIVNWLDGASNFEWENYSVPSHDGCEETSTAGLKRCLTRQINPTQCIIIIAGMYAAYSEWIDYEIDEAVRLNKIIIGVRPRGNERIPLKITNNARQIVNWNSASLISAIREYI
ncbi:MAG: TIR domain-containing protein [Halodesulfovibrio sp.]